MPAMKAPCAFSRQSQKGLTYHLQIICAAPAAPRPSQPELHTSLPPLSPGPSRSTPQSLTRTSRHTRLDNLVRPPSAVLQHPGSSTSTLGINPSPIHAFFFCTYIRRPGLPARVALGIPPTAGVLSGCPFITDIVMSGTSYTPSPTP
jgi:hypothetical protein